MEFIQKMSLKVRFAVILFPAIFGLLGLSIMLVKSSYHDYKAAHEITVSASYLTKVSDLIHELQKERMISAGFLRGTFAEKDLDAQRVAVDSKEKEIENMFSVLSAHDVEEFKKTLVVFDKIRQEVNKKGEMKVILKLFADEMEELFRVQADRVKEFSFVDLDSKLLSMPLLESSKENAGKIRGTLTGVIATNVPISQQEVTAVAILEKNISMTLKFPTLNVSKDTLVGIEGILASNDWQQVNLMIKTISEKASEGNFGLDAKEFATKMTNIIDQINIFIKKELQSVQKTSDDVSSKAKMEMISGIVIVSILILFTCLLAYFISQNILTTLSEVERNLTSNADVVSSSASQMSAASQGLSSATAEQAASLTETSTAMDEINSMVQKNVESSKQTAKFAIESSNSANEGQVIITKMTQAINEIKDSNLSFGKAVDESNQQFAQIVQLINSIGEKTEIINDIVFQTKLLSFNASVEAARAGEHGRGFAVVAEEVGSLAEMSKNAAKEITDLLTDSIQKVQNITKDTSSMMSRMMQISQDKINSGIQYSQECDEILRDIVEKVDKTADLSQGIAAASEEQALGVQEVMIAINSLNDVVQVNSATAQQTASSSQELSSQAESLVVTLNKLAEVIKGKTA